MPISFCEIYNQNLAIKDDPVLGKLSPPDFYQLSWRYLLYAISYFYKDDTVDTNETLPRVGQYTPYSCNNFSYTGDGMDDTFVLTSPAIINGLFYVEVLVDGIKDDITYQYVEATNSIVISPTPPLYADINISNYQIGEFTGAIPLNQMEITILSEGMNIPYLEQAQATRDILEMAVYSGTFKEHSRAEHLQRVSVVVDSQRKYVDLLIMEYSYKYNMENYMGLKGNFS